MCCSRLMLPVMSSSPQRAAGGAARDPVESVLCRFAVTAWLAPERVSKALTTTFGDHCAFEVCMAPVGVVPDGISSYAVSAIAVAGSTRTSPAWSALWHSFCACVGIRLLPCPGNGVEVGPCAFAELRSVLRQWKRELNLCRSRPGAVVYLSGPLLSSEFVRELTAPEVGLFSGFILFLFFWLRRLML